MKKLSLINILIICCVGVFAQKADKRLLAEYEDTLKVMANEVMNAASETERRIANDAFITSLREVLQYEKSFTFPFDSLITISRIKSPDKNFRIFNWLLKKDNDTYEYYGIVQYYNKIRKRFELITLNDNSANIRNPEHADLDAKNWYGGLYYEIIYLKKSGKKYYTLLSYDLNDNYSKKKIIDVMYFSGKNKIKFGLPIFKKSKNESQKRVILEYDAKTTISLKYHKEKNKIIFDHLAPIKKDLTGLYEYYIPEGTFNAYIYKNNKWWLKKDVDIRNTKKTPKIRKPDRGLIPK